MKKKILLLTVIAALLFGILAACGTEKKAKNPETISGKEAPSESTEVTLKVGAALVPHAEILNFIKPKLKEQDVNLEVVTLDDEAQLNPSLADKQIDANYFQHIPYLNSVSKEKGYKFAVVAKVHVEPIGFYSQKIKSIDELKEGATIAVPNNPSNEYRSLVLLQANGLIKLKDGINNYSATPSDIADNPKKLKFVEVEAAQLARTLQDVDGAVINTNFVLEAKIDPESALFREDANSPYANIIVVRQGDENRPEIKKLVEVITSQDVADFIKSKYGVAVVPAFSVNSSSQGNTGNGETLIFGVAPGPYGDMIKIAIKPGLEKRGYKVELKEFTDYVQPDLALNNGEISANMFQHVRYLNKFSADHNLKLTAVIKIPTAGLGIYSKKLKAKNLDELKAELRKGDVVTIANDATNLARALVLLKDNGIITIKKDIDPTKASEKDIDRNPYGLVFQPVEAAQLPRTLDSVTISLVNGNYAIAAGIPLSSAIVKEKLVEDTINLIVVRTEDKDKQFVKDIKEVVESEDFKNEIESSKYEFREFQRPEWYISKWNIQNK